MEQQKHTPGPWEAEWHRKYKQWNVFPESGKAVVSVTDLCGEYSKEETEANARLIAAAPELLEALQGLLDCMAIPSSICKERPAYEAARAAIAKATGS